MPSRWAVRITRQAISPRFAIRIFPNIGLHPEDPEARWLDRRVQRRRQPQTEHHARIGRIDHTVVPQARARIIWMALRFVLLADRRFELLFLLRWPGLALRFQVGAS